MDTISTDTMKRAIASDYASMREEQAASFAADCGTANNGRWFIDTRLTRDERRSNNGGEYSFWVEYWHADGKTCRLERASCDFWQPMDEPEICDGIVPFRRYEGGDGERKIVAVEQDGGEVYVYTVTTPSHFTDEDGRQYQDTLKDWEAFEAWKAQFPGLH